MREGSSGSATAARAVVVALFVGLALTACGQPTGFGQLIGTRPVPSAAPVNVVIDTSALINSLNSELDLANSTTTITDESAQLAQEFNTLLTIKQSERLSALQQLGAQIISTRLAAIAQVRRQVLALPLNSSQKYQIVYLLDSATAGLHGMQAKISTDQLVDVARVDVKSVAAFRVYGLLLPQCHMLIAAYDLQHLISVYSNEKTTLQDAINKAVLNGTPYGSAQSNVNDLGAQISQISYYTSNAIAVLPYLTSAGYPGNRSTITAIRGQLNQASTASTNAANDVLAAKAALGI